jgi:COMPASS component SWD1
MISIYPLPGFILRYHIQMLARHRIVGAGSIKALDIAPPSMPGNRARLMTNSSDRVLREFVIPSSYPTPPPSDLPLPVPTLELEIVNRYSDPITRTAWTGMALKPIGTLLAGADQSTHKIYIWDTRDGRFVTTLDGGREALADVHVRAVFVCGTGSATDGMRQWHPTKPSIASVTKHGNILIWHAPAPERWGAFAGGFEEVDENVWYEEREDEFDLVRL